MTRWAPRVWIDISERKDSQTKGEHAGPSFLSSVPSFPLPSSDFGSSSSSSSPLFFFCQSELPSNPPSVSLSLYQQRAARTSSLSVFFFLSVLFGSFFLGSHLFFFLSSAFSLSFCPFLCCVRVSASRLLPKPSDLSYCLWESNFCCVNDSSNFQVVPDQQLGLLFKHRRDRKTIDVNPEADPGDNSKRHEIETDEYIQVVIYDHMSRKKG